MCRLLIQRFQLFVGCLRPHAEHRRTNVVIQIALCKAVAGKYLRQRLHLFARRCAVLAQNSRINACDNGDVFRPLHASLNFERGYACIAKRLQTRQQTQILQAHRIAVFSAIRQPARLRAQAAVAASSANDGGQFTLSGIAHAQRTVHKHLGFHAGFLRDVLNFFQRQLTRQHHAGESQFFCLPRAFQRMNGQLRRCMQHGIRKRLPNTARRTEILHNQRVRTCIEQQPHIAQQRRNLSVGHQRIDGNIGLYTAQTAIRNRFAHLFRRKVFRTASGIKRAKSQINGARSVLYGSAHRFHRACRSQQLRQFSVLHHLNNRAKRALASLS